MSFESKTTTKIGLFSIQLIRKILSFSFKISNWKIKGSFPPIPKFVVIVAPHSSIIDFWKMFTARMVLNLSTYNNKKQALTRNIHWLVKKSLFKWPIKKILVQIGAISIDRSKKNDTVNNLVSMAIKSNTFILGIAPDGKRTNQKNKPINLKWKTGFYHIAKQAKIPIVACFINNKNKNLIISKPFYLSGTFNSDMKKIIHFYKN